MGDKPAQEVANHCVELAKRNIVDLIYKEAKVEGINVTYSQIAQLYENYSVNGLTVEDIIKINNLKHAWQFIFDTLDEPVTMPLMCLSYPETKIHTEL